MQQGPDDPSTLTYRDPAEDREATEQEFRELWARLAVPLLFGGVAVVVACVIVAALVLWVVVNLRVF